MRRTGLLFVTALAVAGLSSACQKDESSLGKKLDDIDKRLASIESKLEKGIAAPGAARGAARPRPARPDPSKVYSVPIAGAPFKGAENAKVTVVEAFEFA